MQKLYRTIELAKDSGCTKAAIKDWVSKGWIKPCLLNGVPAKQPVLLYTQDERDRLMNAVRNADGHRRSIPIFLNRTLHAARDCNAVTTAELATRCGCSGGTVRKALVRLGYPRCKTIGILEEDVGEVKALCQKFREEGQQKRAATWEAVREAAGSKPESPGNITLHIKGLTISLGRKDAEALAEEILAQI